MTKLIAPFLLLCGCEVYVLPDYPAPKPFVEKTFCEKLSTHASIEELGKAHFKSQWTPKGLVKELIPIAWNESYFNRNIDHLPSVRGPYYTAFGPLGHKPSTAHIEYKRSKKIQKEYPGLFNPDDFLKMFYTDVEFYNKLSNLHWWFLKSVSDNDVSLSAFKWHLGPNLAEYHYDMITSDDYVLRYLSRAG
jgi:hypothetical protein